MWPRKQCILRLGRHGCELWLEQSRAVLGLAKQSVPQAEAQSPYEPLRLAIQQLAQHVPARARVQVIVDSHWLPVLLVDTGHAPLAGGHINTLAMHRFAEVRGEAVRNWAFMSNYLAGDRKALAFGCPPQLQQVVQSTLAENAAPRAFCGLQPTLSWAMAKAPAKLGMQSNRCTVLHEQDRSLMVLSQGASLLGFHPALPAFESPQQFMHEAQRYAWRCGVPNKDWRFQVLAFEPRGPHESSDLGIPELNWSTLVSWEPTA